MMDEALRSPERAEYALHKNPALLPPGAASRTEEKGIFSILFTTVAPFFYFCFINPLNPSIC
jgi:hypothetical protein